jgi:hypothetical protein
MNFSLNMKRYALLIILASQYRGTAFDRPANGFSGEEHAEYTLAQK